MPFPSQTVGSPEPAATVTTYRGGVTRILYELRPISSDRRFLPTECSCQSVIGAGPVDARTVNVGMRTWSRGPSSSWSMARSTASAGHLGDRVVHGGERRRRVRGERDVVEADRRGPRSGMAIRATVGGMQGTEGEHDQSPSRRPSEGRAIAASSTKRLGAGRRVVDCRPRRGAVVAVSIPQLPQGARRRRSRRSRRSPCDPPPMNPNRRWPSSTR